MKDLDNIKQIDTKQGFAKDVQNNLYKVLDDYIPKRVLSNKNRGGTWQYRYNEKYDFVNISKTGKVGEIINISVLSLTSLNTQRML